jgi:hypothetical protein
MTPADLVAVGAPSLSVVTGQGEIIVHLGQAAGQANLDGAVRSSQIRRLPEKNVPDCAGFSFVFKKR